jgi:hypothetical protein
MTRCALVLFLCFSSLLFAQSPNHNPNKKEPPILGPHWARGQAKRQPASNANNLLYHGGPIMVNAAVKAIFWGSGWSSPADKIAGMDAWYRGESGTPYAATVDEYKDSSGHQVSSSLSYGGHLVDLSSAPQNPSTSQVLREVCSKISSPVSNGYYPVYLDHKRKGNFCAYHSNGSCGGVNVQFAFFWNLDGDAGCNPVSSISGQSEGLQALANVSGHELSEARSDPHGDAWYASNGEENADECAWTFGGQFVVFNPPAGTNSNYVDWKIQGNWSNGAANGTSPNGPGYTTSLGTGCVDGSNYPGPYTK